MQRINETSRHGWRYGLMLASLVIVYLMPGRLFALEPNIDRPGGDYKHFPLSTADPKLCEQECRNDPAIRCKAFTYVKPTASAPKGICWLKETIPSPVENASCTSGVARQLICAHGNSGQIQDKQADASHHGWGVDYDVAGTGSWLQYAVPTNEADTIIEGVQLRFTLSNPKYGWIAAVHVYDGETVIKKFDNQIYGSSLSSEAPKTTDVLLPLDKPVRVSRGMGISILPQTKQAGGLSKIVNVEVHSVCALVRAVP